MSDRIRPFSSGRQFSDWQASNCERCTKFTKWIQDPPVCEIDYELSMAYLFDGEVSPEIAERMGYNSGGGNQNWKCNEVEWTQGWIAKVMEMNQ